MWPFGKQRSFGEQGETLAAKFLRRQGYKILERNLRIGRYEVDILARDRDTVVFVEVKTRRDSEYAAPEDNITPAKQNHLRNAAALYIARHGAPETYYRFDVVSVVLPEKGKPAITLFRNAFEGR